MDRPRYSRSDFTLPTLEVCRRLMGQLLVRLEPDGSRVSGLVVEAEAYVGQDDLGCHASAGRTARNQAIWGPPGHAYVYFTYGMHWMLNLVTEAEHFPAAVLLRAILPCEGQARMLRRRSSWRRRRGASTTGAPRLADGPAKLCQALGLNGSWNGYDLCGRGTELFIERRPAVATVTSSPRVGLNQVPEPWKSIPWRFQVAKRHHPRLLEQEGFS
ncbi:MAG: DNA-3-methyladenine glycosylase [Anaerolineales bacterium]